MTRRSAIAGTTAVLLLACGQSPIVLHDLPELDPALTYPTLVRMVRHPCESQIERSDNVVGVHFRLVINRDGSVRHVEVLQMNEGDQGKTFSCGREVLDALRGLHYTPALKDGKPVAVRSRIGIVMPASRKASSKKI